MMVRFEPSKYIPILDLRHKISDRKNFVLDSLKFSSINSMIEVLTGEYLLVYLKSKSSFRRRTVRVEP